MALVIYKTGKRKFITPEQGKRIWELMNGEREATPKEQACIDKVDKLYLSKHNAPLTYMVKFADRFAEEAGNTSVKNRPRMPYKD